MLLTMDGTSHKQRARGIKGSQHELSRERETNPAKVDAIMRRVGVLNFRMKCTPNSGEWLFWTLS